jgi:hypothetical protein
MCVNREVPLANHSSSSLDPFLFRRSLDTSVLHFSFLLHLNLFHVPIKLPHVRRINTALLLLVVVELIGTLLLIELIDTVLLRVKLVEIVILVVEGVDSVLCWVELVETWLLVTWVYIALWWIE